jgi:indolepyruvate ferredoxin oxidoreductase
VLVSEGDDIAVDDRFGRESGRIYLTGIQALARLPVDSRREDLRANFNTAGFISGYEGSPLAGYDLELGRQSDLLEAHDIVFRPAVNEELAATSVQGTQLASASSRSRIIGVTGWWYGKSPGLDRAADAIRHSNLMGTHPLGGAIALVGDDPAAKSSTAPGRRTHCSPISACQRYIPPMFRMCSIWDYTQWPCRGAAGCGLP